LSPRHHCNLTAGAKLTGSRVGNNATGQLHASRQELALDTRKYPSGQAAGQLPPRLRYRNTPDFLGILLNRPVSRKFSHPCHVQDRFPNPQISIQESLGDLVLAINI